jgi:hypothetical protein
MNTTNGPYETEAQIRELPAVRAVYDAFDADPGAGKMAPHNFAMLINVCEAAGVTLGGPSSYDRQILAWLAGWEPQACAVVAGLITRASVSAQLAPAVLARTYDLSTAEQRTILAALDEAADHKRELAVGCADCADQTCGNCEVRLRTARSYEAVSGQIQAQIYGSPAIEAEP